MTMVNVDCSIRACPDPTCEAQVNSIQRDVVLALTSDDGEVLADVIHDDSRLSIPVASPNLEGNEFHYLVDSFISTWISSTGKYVNRFEEEFAAFCGVKHGVAVSSGTAALHLALATLGVGEGDEVIVPDLTFAATINAVLHAKATPIIVDVDEESWCIDPNKILQAITEKTKAMIPVHVYGQPCDMDAIMKIADNFGLFVIEDAAEAHGALFKEKRVGCFGHISCFSFYADKVVTTGEGGMCLTNVDKLNDNMRVLRDHGMNKSKRYWHDVVGFNYRLTNMQAAIGVAQLERIEDMLAAKNKYEQDVKITLAGMSNVVFQRDDLVNRNKIVWLTCILVNDGRRDEYVAKLNDCGIDTRPFFYPLSSMPLYQRYAIYPTEISKKLSAMGINLPSSQPLGAQALETLKSILSS